MRLSFRSAFRNLLPDDLKGDAMVITYSEDGTRRTLREGTNGLYCMPKESESNVTIWCRPTVALPMDDAVHRWIAEGRSTEEANALMVTAFEDGTLPSIPSGMMFYRATGPDRDSLLLAPIVIIPNATADSTALSTERSLEHPWLMFPGTVTAHIMIPRRPLE